MRTNAPNIVQQPTDTRSATVWQRYDVGRAERADLLGQRGHLILLTGRPGAGKTTVARGTSAALHDRGLLAYVLDGDNVRKGLSADLGFSPEDRAENLRRVGEVARLMLDAGLVVIVGLVSPLASARAALRASVAPEDFSEVYCRCSLEACEERDPKGMYRRARQGEIRDFTGVDSPYEAPTQPELILDCEAESPERCVQRLVQRIVDLQPASQPCIEGKASVTK